MKKLILVALLLFTMYMPAKAQTYLPYVARQGVIGVKAQAFEGCTLY